jgi:hypothetical protein
MECLTRQSKTLAPHLAHNLGPGGTKELAPNVLQILSQGWSKSLPKPCPHQSYHQSDVEHCAMTSAVPIYLASASDHDIDFKI